MYTRTIIWAIIVFAGVSSCEKDIDINLHDTNQEVVVDGSIENGKPPLVILTRSLNYFSAIDTNILKDAFIHQAVVTVSDSINSVTLKEYAMDTLNGNHFFYYTTDTISSHALVGKRGHTYKLSIETEGHQMEALTTIPLIGFHVDSVWWVPGVKDQKADSTQCFLMAKIRDPLHQGDHARYFTKRNNEPFYPGLSSVANDEITNGTTFNFLMDRGANKNSTIDFNDYGYFEPGDTVTLKFCNIDKTTFDFWSTWEYAWSSSGNPFSSPIAIRGNVNGALGYWGGYAAQYSTIILTP